MNAPKPTMNIQIIDKSFAAHKSMNAYGSHFVIVHVVLKNMLFYNYTEFFQHYQLKHIT